LVVLIYLSCKARARTAAGTVRGPNGGAADTLDEAKAAFRTAWERRL
jgi:hypothetical protein